MGTNSYNFQVLLIRILILILKIVLQLYLSFSEHFILSNNYSYGFTLEADDILIKAENFTG